MRNIEDPVTEQHGADWRDETVTTHPAFGQISATRVSCSPGDNLYGSDFRHQNSVMIRIKRSELHRSLNRDRHFGREELIEVALSESQWATFVSAMNIGDGVPCTIQHIDRMEVPGLPDPEKRTDQFSKEMQSKLNKTVSHVQDAIAKVDEMGLSKKKAADLKDNLNRALMELQSNLPFVAKQFEEHLEDTVEGAKQEIHGYMSGALQRAGLDAITNGQMPLAIEHKEDE